MTHLLADLRLAARSLARAPLFTFVAVVSIALGIGANTAVFTLLDQVALRPLPIQRPDELVQIHARGEENYGGGSGNGTELSWPMFRDFQDKAAGFAGVVGRVSTSAARRPRAAAASASTASMVSGNFFEVLGVGAALGRVFTPADDRTPGGHPLAVLGYDYWRRRFARPRRRPRAGGADQRPAIHGDRRRGPRLLRARARACRATSTCR